MIVRFSRIFLIILVVFVGAIYLPQYYWVSFEERISRPIIYYSPVIEKFIIGRYATSGYYYTDETGKKYNRSETDHILPLLNYRVLAARDMMPDSIMGVKIDIKEVRKNNLIINIRPKDIKHPQIQLYPLFESKPPRLRLNLPKSFFRITDRMEFIDCQTNQIDESLSQTFTRVLQEKGFHFPARNIFGNPTTRKPYDAGYFVVDAIVQFFHIKQISGKPFCEKIPLPEGMSVKWMGVSEKEIKEFYGLLINEKNEIFLLMFDHYRFQKLPVSGYDPERSSLRLMGTLFHRWITVKYDDHLNAYLMDRNYHLLRTYEEKWKGKYQTRAGIVSKYIFPFEIALKDKSQFVTIRFTGFNYQALFFNFFLALITFFWVIRKRKLHFRSWLDVVFVVITGIYGFIGIFLFEHPSD